MVFKVRMPKIDANVREGTIGRWLKQPGARLEAGEPLVEIITDKAAFELDSERAGFLRRCVAPDKSVVPVGYVIALVSEDEAEPLPDVSRENEETMRRHKESLLFGAAGPSGQPAPEPHAHGASAVAARPRATPAARRLARRKGVPLEKLTPPPDGVIREADVLEHLRAAGRSQKGSGDGG